MTSDRKPFTPRQRGEQLFTARAAQRHRGTPMAIGSSRVWPSFSREQGFVTHLLHYFDRTGTVFADAGGDRGVLRALVADRDDAIGWIRTKRPAARIGLFGYSLGAHLAASQSVRDSRVGAAVILAGGLEGGPCPQVSHVPPFLFLHGANDTRVPMSDARQWEQALAAAGGKPEFHGLSG